MLNVNGQFKITDKFSCGDKSMSHRALILAAFSAGESVIENISLCRDVLTTAECLEKLGAVIEIDGTTARVKPIVEPADGTVLDCKNSGTTARLLAGLVAGLGVSATFIGDGSLVKRPMNRVTEPLKKMGADIRPIDGGLFEIKRSSLVGCRIVSDTVSAQVKSAVLIAGLFADGETVYVERTPTRDHTEIMLSFCNADITVRGSEITVRRGRIQPFHCRIPNDTSSASYLAALALLTGTEITVDNISANERRTGFFKALSEANADVEIHSAPSSFGEKVASVRIGASSLTSLKADTQTVCDAIDEIPLLAAIAIATKGEHFFENVGELRYKECNRINAIMHMASVCGQRAEFDGADLRIISNGRLPARPHFTAFGDHRIAMCETILATVAGGGTVDETPFEVSFPNFLPSLGIVPLKLGLIGESVSDSKSPLLMGYLAERAQVCCSYETVSLPRSVSDKELKSIISSFDGLNVTMPFKRRAAELLGADVPSVNTAGRTVAPQSTDGYGILRSLQNHGIDVRNKPVWIVGAGGASEECVRVLKQCGCSIRIVNRTEEHAKQLTVKYGLDTDAESPYGVLSFVPECGFERSVTLPDSVRFVLVAAYKGESGLRDQAKARGLEYVDGLEMLYHQGAKSFALWSGTEIQNDFGGFAEYLQRASSLDGKYPTKTEQNAGEL